MILSLYITYIYFPNIYYYKNFTGYIRIINLLYSRFIYFNSFICNSYINTHPQLEPTLSSNAWMRVQILINHKLAISLFILGLTNK